MSVFNAKTGTVWMLVEDDATVFNASKHGITLKNDASVFVVLDGHLNIDTHLNMGRSFRRAYCLLTNRHISFTRDSFMNKFAKKLA